jgi:hypothetical protein
VVSSRFSEFAPIETRNHPSTDCDIWSDYMTARRTAVALTAVALTILGAVAQSAQGWVLPVPDGAGVQPSTPSVHGNVIRIVKGRMNVIADNGHGGAGAAVAVQLTSRTKFFTAYGGPYERDELRPGQYVWVWYITADPNKAGAPPQAAVVMLWSKDPEDRPSEQVRSSFDLRK